MCVSQISYFSVHEHIIEQLFYATSDGKTAVEAAYDLYFKAATDRMIQPVAKHVFGQSLLDVFGSQVVTKKRITNCGIRKCMYPKELSWTL